MTKRLQIILAGWERDRLVYGIKQKSPNKVIFISSDPKKAPNAKWGDKTTALAEEIGESIKNLIEYEIIYFDYHDINSCLEKTVNLLEENIKKFEEITVNISSGTTIMKMAMNMASQYYPIELFYVIPKEYTHPCEIITKGARGIVDLPTINLRKIIKPKKTQKELIELLDEKEKTFTQLTKEFAQKKGKKLGKEEMKTMKAWLFYHLKKMKEKDLLNTKVKEKIMTIKLTQTGRFMKLIQEKEKEEEKQTKLKKIKNNKISLA
jgi:hypothetical protein